MDVFQRIAPLTLLTIVVVLTILATVRAKLPIRLAGHQKPFHYHLAFTFDGHESFEGKASISLQITEPTDVLTIHADPQYLNITDAQVWSLYPSAEVPLNNNKSWEFNRELEDGLSILLGKTIGKGSYTISLGYTARLCGLGRPYVMCANTTAIEYPDFATTFEPLGARTFFPCFDEPYMKATFSVSITHHPDLTALCNARIMNTTKTDNATMITYYETTPRMSTYLLTISVGKFWTVCNTSSHNVLFCAHAPLSIDNLDYDRVQSGLDRYIENCDRLTDFFQIGYPLAKMDIVAPPTHFSAMENWGIIVHGYNIFNITDVIIHELVHQWFGNLVTMNDWCELWLNEGFANYFSTYFSNQLHYITATPIWIFWSDPKLARKLSCPFKDNTDLNAIKYMFRSVSAIPYVKGSATARMMHTILGDDSFFRGLRSYLLSHAYRSADSGHLLDHLSLHSSLPIKEIMDSWINKPGWPEVHIFIENGSYYLAQIQTFHKRALKGISLSYVHALEEPIWQIPITYISEGNRTPSDIIWFTNRTMPFPEIESIVSSGQWYFLNPGHNIPYIVNYDLDNWDRLLNMNTSADPHGGIPKDDNQYVRLQAKYFTDTLANFTDFKEQQAKKHLQALTRLVPTSIKIQVLFYKLINATITGDDLEFID